MASERVLRTLRELRGQASTMGATTWTMALDDVLRELDPPMPPDVVEVRVAVVVNADGLWAASGSPVFSDSEALGAAGVEPGDATYWLTARLARPKPAPEVQADVEPPSESQDDATPATE